MPQASPKRNLYLKWFHTTVPFYSWKVLMQIVVNIGNATGNVDAMGHGPGAVVAGYPIRGNYKTETWHGTPNTSIVPWWINVGQYKPGQ